MSQFSELLSTAIGAAGLSLREASARTGINLSILSRLVSGARSPSNSNLASLRQLSADPVVWLELACAHLADEAAALGLPPDQLQISPRRPGDSPHKSLPLALQADLDAIAAESLRNADFAALVRDWAVIVRQQQTRPGDVYSFPEKPAPAAAEAPPPRRVKSPPAPAAGSRPAPPSLPRGRSQQPPA